MKQTAFFLQKHGAWTYLAGAFFFFLSWSFLDSWSGIAGLILGILLLVSDPAVLFLQKEKPGKPLLITYGVAALSVILFLIRELIPASTGAEVTETASRLRLVLSFLFLLACGFAFLYRLALGLEMAGMHSADLKDARTRIVRSSVLAVAAAVCVYTLFNYVATQRNPILDLSPGYYSFSENSRGIIENINSKVTIHAFLPVQQAVRDRESATTQPELFRIAEDVRVMLEQLPVINSKISVEFHNADLPEMLISEFGSVRNGTIIIRSPRETVSAVDDKPYTERRVYVYNEKDMLKLERESVRALIQVSSPPRTVYFTAMNGERFQMMGGAQDPRAIETWKEMLRFYNFRVQKLDTSRNWPGEIPEDADAVIMAGPVAQYNDAAKEAIIEYLKNGGSVMALISPDSNENFNWLLSATGAGYRFQSAFLSHLPRAPGLIITDNIQDHRITENLNVAGRANIAMPGLGYFEQTKDSEKELEGFKVTPFLKTPFNTLNDKNKNGKADEGEKKAAYVLGLAIENEQSGAKLAVFSNIDWLTEIGLRIRVDHRNPILASDSLFWMTESDLAAGLVPQKKETRNIRVTDTMKLKNMIAGILLFPLTVAAGLGFAVFLYRKRTRFTSGSS